MATYYATINIGGAGFTATKQSKSARGILAKIKLLYKNDRGCWGAPGSNTSKMQLPTLQQIQTMPMGKSLKGQYLVAHCGGWYSCGSTTIKKRA